MRQTTLCKVLCDLGMKKAMKELGSNDIIVVVVVVIAVCHSWGVLRRDIREHHT